MSQDLSQAFGRPATSSLRGLLPPRDGRTRWSDPSDEEPRPEPEDLEAVEDGFEDTELEDDEPDDEPEDDESQDDVLEDDELEDDELEDDEPEDSESQDDELEDDELEDDVLEDDEPEDDEPEDSEPEDSEPEDSEPEDDDQEDVEPAAPPVVPRRAETPRRAARRTPAASGRRTAPTSAAPATSAAARAPAPAPAPSRRGRVRVTARDHVDLLVLLTLRRGPTDGRGVIARLRESSGGTLDVSERTVHVTLHRLARNRLLGRRLGPVSGRRLYALTEAGQRAARARLRQLQALARGVDAVARAAE